MRSSRKFHQGVFRVRTAGARVAAGLVLAALAACGAEQAALAPPQKWQGMEVNVESRPNPPHAGMNEFLVMVTDARGRPAYNLVVSLRTSSQDQWKQAIEDGQVGVYRRAVKLELGANGVLQVQVRSKDAEGILEFPLKMQQ